MPDIFCQTCKQITAHKSVMRRSPEAPATFTGKFAELLGQIATGKHYYKMEPQHFCRVCNCQNVISEPKQAVQPISSPTQVGAH